MWLINGAFVGKKNFDFIKMHGTTIKVNGFLFAWYRNQAFSHLHVTVVW